MKLSFYGADQFILDADHFQRETGTSDVMTYLFNMESDEADAQMRDFLEEELSKTWLP